jgi:hypothetical protein
MFINSHFILLLTTISLTLAFPTSSPGCAFAVDFKTHTVKTIQSPAQDSTSAFLYNADGLYTYDIASSIHRKFTPQARALSKQSSHPFKSTWVKRSPAITLIEDICEGEELLYVKELNVLVFFCGDEGRGSEWEGVREYLRGLNWEVPGCLNDGRRGGKYL